MNEHEQASENCREAIKGLLAKGCQINAVSWFDATHFHINFSTKEEIEAQQRHTAELVADFREKLNKGELKLIDIYSLIVPNEYIPCVKEDLE